MAGADVIPWRPAQGVYLIIETADAPVPPDALIDVPGIAGIWWYRGALAPEPYSTDARGLQVTYRYLDDDPVATASALKSTCGNVGRRVTPLGCWPLLSHAVSVRLGALPPRRCRV